MPKVELSTRAPDFTLDDYTGKSVSLSDFTGKKKSCLSSDCPTPSLAF